MGLQSDIARSHLETLIERLTGIPKATSDKDGDYLVDLKGSLFYARIDGDDEPICRIYAIISDGVAKTTEMLDSLNMWNSRLTFLRVIWVEGQILLEGNCLALSMAQKDLEVLCADVLHASNLLDHGIVSRFGGTPVFKGTTNPDFRTVREGRGPTYL